MNNKKSQTTILTDYYLSEIMKQSYEFWHESYLNSLVNYPLIWKKALESDSDIIKKIKIMRENSNQNVDLIIQQFFEMWSYAIRDSNFEIAKKSMGHWDEFWKNTTDEQLRTCNEILHMMETYWRKIQSTNIE